MTIARNMGVRYKFNYQSIADIQEEIRALVPIYADIDFEKNLPWQSWNLDALNNGKAAPAFDPAWITLEPVMKKTIGTGATDSVRRRLMQYWKEKGIK